MRRPPSFTRGELNVYPRRRDVSEVTRALRHDRPPGRCWCRPWARCTRGTWRWSAPPSGCPGAVVVVSIFVNPLQFGAGEDLDRYPRTFDADLETAARPRASTSCSRRRPTTMYPDGPRTTVQPGPLGAVLEGASRPDALRRRADRRRQAAQLVRPDLAVFGEKDYQQLVLIRRMVADLYLGVEVVGVPTVREPDGLALSSRNRYLDADAARAGRGAVRGAAGRRARRGRRAREAALDAARAVLDDGPGVDLDYLELSDPDLGPAPDRGHGRLLVAARVGTTRLIDNIAHRPRSPRRTSTGRACARSSPITAWRN